MSILATFLDHFLPFLFFNRAQCDNYLRNWGVLQEPTYDTAGSAKMIKEKNLVDCAAIASDLAGKTYGLEVLDTNIEDDENNFTRFLLLSRSSVSSLIPPTMAAKTSVVFVLPNNPGALYKALACFSLRDIDFCKIESRPTSVDLLQFLKFRSRQQAPSLNALASGKVRPSSDETERQASEAAFNRELPRFRCLIYPTDKNFQHSDY